MVKPLISIIVLTYNQEHTVDKTLESILSQNTIYSYEVIIGEDCSADGTRLICERFVERYPDKVKLLPATPNKGLMRNYRDCVMTCEGKYIACCAGDDWWHNLNKLQLQATFLETNPDYGVVHTDFDIYNKTNNTITKAVYCSTKKDVPDGDVYATLMHANFIAAGSAMYRKSIFDASVNLNLFIELGFMMEDYPMWLAMSQISKFKYLAVSTFSYVLASSSISNSGDDIEKAQCFEGNVMEVRKHFHEIKSVLGLSNEVFQRDYYTTILRQCKLLKKRKLAMNTAFQLFKLHPTRNNGGKFLACAISYIFNRQHS